MFKRFKAIPMYLSDLNRPDDQVVFLKEGYVWFVFKKPSKAVVAVYQDEEQATALIDKLGGKKYFRKERFQINTNRYLEELDKSFK